MDYGDHRLAARPCIAVCDLHGNFFVVAEQHRRIVFAVIDQRVVQPAETRPRIERDVGKAVTFDQIDDDVGLPTAIGFADSRPTVCRHPGPHAQWRSCTDHCNCGETAWNNFRRQGRRPMKNSAQRIRTSHVGRLPVPSGFEETALRLARGEVGGEEVAAQVVPVVAVVVKRQVEIGLDCIGDGEYWSALDIRWLDQQMTGLGMRPLKPGEVGSMRESTRERDVFRTLYADMDRVGTIACIPGERPRPPTRERIIVNGPIKSRGTAATQRQLDCFKAAIARSGVALDEAFVPALAPGWLDHFIYNEHYGTDEEFVYALADAMRDKYRAIVEAGFILQIDDPGIATSWDMLKPEPQSRRLPEIRDLADRGAEPCPRRHPVGESALPLVLGQLARRTCQRHTSRTHHRHRSQGEGANLLI